MCVWEIHGIKRPQNSTIQDDKVHQLYKSEAFSKDQFTGSH